MNDFGGGERSVGADARPKAAKAPAPTTPESARITRVNRTSHVGPKSTPYIPCTACAVIKDVANNLSIKYHKICMNQLPLVPYKLRIAIYSIRVLGVPGFSV